MPRPGIRGAAHVCLRLTCDGRVTGPVAVLRQDGRPGRRTTSVVVVTLVVVALVVTLGELGGDVGGRDLAEVDLGAGGVDDLGLLEHGGERLAAGDLGDHGGDLALLVDRLGELVGVHAV